MLFDIKTSKAGRIFDRGVDRMWVIVKSRRDTRYVGILDNDPGVAEDLRLNEGDEILFGPEHIAEIDYPSREYIVAKYGTRFFHEAT